MHQLHQLSPADEHDRLRPLSYPRRDVFVLCFSIADPLSFENVKSKWIPELVHYAKGTPIVLVGTKVDLREDPVTLASLRERHMDPIQHAQGVFLCNDVGAARYLECSALTQAGVKTVFDEAMLAALNTPRRRIKWRSRFCIIA